MDGGLLILFEMILVFGLVVAFGVWQLRDLKRLERERAAKREDGKPPPPEKPHA